MQQNNPAQYIETLDTTLRDGAQGEGISFSAADKLAICAHLEKLGVTYIEAGNPASNPKDVEFFERVRQHDTLRTKVVAFGSTRRKDISCDEDESLAALLDAETEICSIFGKSALSQVELVLHTSAEENLRMIEETCRYLTDKGRTVFFDAEHFFAGFAEDKDYALETLRAALRGGAARLVLCDTSGGSMPGEILAAVQYVCAQLPNAAVGIHCHNDCGLAVANSMAAVEAGCTHVQGTVLGIGERCGNADLATLAANLQLKCGRKVLPEDALEHLTPICRAIAEICNISIGTNMPYIGLSAFAHKAGMHVDAVLKQSDTFEHVSPESVGNERRILLSEMSGRSTLVRKIRRIAPHLTRESPEIVQIIERLKRREHRGYEFEGAEGSFELLVRRTLGEYSPCFELIKYRVTSERPYEEGCSASAMVKIRVGGEEILRCAEGDGPVNALDKALRKALSVFYPQLVDMHLIDYKVRVIETRQATASMVRVLICSADRHRMWTTVGVSVDIMEASFKALCDSVEYKLIKDSM